MGSGQCLIHQLPGRRRPRFEAAAQNLRHGLVGNAALLETGPGGSLIATGLTDFNEVAVWVTDIGADFVRVVDGFGDEVCAAGRPLAVRALDVGDADVEKGANRVGVVWCGEVDGRLVRRGTGRRC
jgi:hypothetical protein